MVVTAVQNQRSILSRPLRYSHQLSLFRSE